MYIVNFMEWRVPQHIVGAQLLCNEKNKMPTSLAACTIYR